jgi:hypothetical protein
VFVAAGGAAGVAFLGGAFAGGAEAVAVVFGCVVLGAGFGADCALAAGFGLGATGFGAGFGAGFGPGFGAGFGAGDWAAGAGFCALFS